MRIQKRMAGLFYLWQIESYGKGDLDADGPADIFRAAAVMGTPQGYLIGRVATAREGDLLLDQLIGMTDTQARAYLAGVGRTA